MLECICTSLSANFDNNTLHFDVHIFLKILKILKFLNFTDDKVFDLPEDDFSMRRNSSTERAQHVVLSSGEEHVVETGVRIYDPKTSIIDYFFYK